ncbi:MAG: methyltransferase [Flavobacteriales bacterium]|nr:MAG: methyltransferase [Flavobacteriales bacterium]
MSTKFQFKQFSIEQNLCAMKVGTDGVLLGAWTTIPDGLVLDIGTGTGVISLMLAQRNANSIIHAIDIDKNAFLQSKSNFESSLWSDRIKAFHSSLQDFKPDKRYQLIVSNPPFFVNSSKSENEAKNTARHTDELSFDALLQSVASLLLPDGIFSVVLPFAVAQEFTELAKTHQLFLNRLCEVKPNLAKPPKRALMEFSLHKKELETTALTIETNQRHVYTPAYQNLTKDFYLEF